MTARYRRIVEYITRHPWAIERDTLDAIVEIVALRAEGARFAGDEVEARLAAAREKQGDRRAESFIGVIPIYGVIMPKANLMTEFSGGTTVEGIRGALRAALVDEEVSRIIFDVDSPGGSVEGIPELADEIRAARGQKPMTAVANYTMGSAAYFLGSQADEIVASPSAMVGSIGVYALHTDQSGFDEQVGIKPTYISAGKYKVDGNPHEPLSDTARDHMQASVDYSYDQFVRAVAAARGVKPAEVRSGFGEGQLLDPGPAKAAGLIDRIATLDDVMSSKAPRMRSRDAAAVELERVAVAEPVEDGAPVDAFAFERERRERLGLRPA